MYADVLKKDFKDALAEIDFTRGYDPCSRKFQVALSLGQMWRAVSTLGCDDDIEEELAGAEKYLAAYNLTKDEAYKGMTKDELKHAGILIKRYYASADEQGKAMLEKLESERQELASRIEGGEE